MAVLTVYPDATPGTDTVDGSAGEYEPLGLSWAAIVAASGNSSFDSLTTFSTSLYSDNSTDKWQGLFRLIFLFKTSSLGSSATISSAILSLYGVFKSDPLGISPDIDIYTSNPVSNTTLTGTDFSTLGIISQTGIPITYAGFSIVGYNDFTFNATGISNINKTGISKFGARNANYDVSGVAPTWSSNQDSFIEIYSADNGTNKPKLVITYTTGAAGISVGWLRA